MAIGRPSLVFLIAAAVGALVGVLVTRSRLNGEQADLQLVLDGLLSIEKQLSDPPAGRIAVGFGACSDLIVPARTIFRNQKAPNAPRNHDVIESHEDLLETFTYYFKHGAAAERFVANETLFRELLRKVKSSAEFRTHLGGNAPLMASRFALEGAQVLLGAHMSSELQGMLPDGVAVSGQELDEDDHHVLLEYDAGEKFVQYKAPRANRFIIHSDQSNPQFDSATGFIEKLKNFQPNLLVLGGLHIMDNFPFREDQLDQSLNRILNVATAIRGHAAVHFEMGSFVDHNLMKRVARQVLPLADSFGMNEQELPNLLSLLKYDNISYVSDSYPRVANILDQTREVFDLVYTPNAPLRSVSRIHVHTLPFQAILRVIKDPKNNIFEWKNTKASAAKAALTAHRHTCGSYEIDVQRTKIMMDDSFTTTNGPDRRRISFKADEPVSCWNETLPTHGVQVEFCVATTLVCTKVLQTGGGGDNVSSAGLVLQV